MKYIHNILLSVLVVVSLAGILSVNAFAPQSSNHCHTHGGGFIQSTTNQPTSTTRLYFFGPKKDDGSPGDYVCKV